MHTALLIAWLACQGSEIATTAIGLSRPGLREGNPLMAGKYRYTVKVSVNVGALIWHRQVREDQKWVIPSIMAGAGCTAAGWNLHMLAQGR
jgi:hypothetical protein